jgi:hypothetical protein
MFALVCLSDDERRRRGFPSSPLRDGITRKRQSDSGEQRRDVVVGGHDDPTASREHSSTQSDQGFRPQAR